MSTAPSLREHDGLRQPTLPLRSASPGTIEVICGPMFSGKSEELIRRLRRVGYARKRAILFKPAVDDRYAVDEVVSHDGMRMPARVVSSSEPILRLAEGYDVVGIDEAQFLDRGIVEVCRRLQARGQRVVVAGLDRDYRREPFGAMPELLSHADDAVKLKAVCHSCGEPAGCTQRLVDGRPAPFSGETVLIGGTDSYEARCNTCHAAG